MRTLGKILVAVGLALAVSTTAGATISVDLIQTGGTYSSGAGASAGDTLTLTIQVSSDGLGPETGLTAAFAEIVYGAETTSFDGGTEAAFQFIGGVLMTPIGAPAADINDNGTKVIGWESQTLTVTGAPVPFSYTFGTANFTLSGLGGSLAIAGNSVVGIENFVDATGSSLLGSFNIIPVPEPTTASLMGLGLIGLTLAGRRRS